MPYTLPPGADVQALADVLDGLEGDALRSGLSQATVDRVVLVAGELLSNALEHGGGRVSIWWHPEGGGRLEVQGRGGPWRADLMRAALPGAEATRGRGLFLVRSLGDGVSVGLESVSVSFERRPDE